MKPAAGVIATSPTTIAGRGADGGHLAGCAQVEQRPGDERRHRREQRVDERERRRGVRGERAAAVESEPAEPEEAGAEQRERDVVRTERLAAVVVARLETIAATTAPRRRR